MPSPVHSHEFVVNFQAFPRPPVASTTALAPKVTKSPVSRQNPTAPFTAPSSSCKEADDLALHEDVDPDRHGAVLQGPDHLEAGAVTDMGEAGVAVPAEVALQDPAVRRAVEQRPPLLEFEDAVGCLEGVDLSHAPVVEHLAAAHGVAEVDLPVVLWPHAGEGGGDAAFGHDGVGLAEEGLAHKGSPGAHLARLDGGPQPRPACPYDDHVEVVPLVVGHQKILGSLKAPEDTR